MKNILITGGAGFIGSNLALQLVARGYNVTVLDNLSRQIHGDNPFETSPLYLSIKEKVNFIYGSITDKSDFVEAVNNQNAIIHLAAETGTGQSMYEIEKYCQTNIIGTSVILDYITNEKHSVQKVIIASSRAIYGEGSYRCTIHGNVYPIARLSSDMERGDFNCKCPFCIKNVDLIATAEDCKIHPTSIYGITKQNQEQMVTTICKAIGIPSVAFRYQNVYGPGQSLTNSYTGILSIFSTLIKNGEDINIFEDGLESRDFVYIDDVVDATILGLENENANYEVFNVGTGIPINVLEVAQTLVNSYNRNDIKLIVSGNFRLGDIRHNYADLTKITSKLGFVPKIDFINGINRFVNWVNNQPNHESNFLSSFEEMKRKGLLK